MLIEKTLFGIRDKVKDALEDLRRWEPPEGYYLAYSGGKDSTVILDLVRRAGVKYDAHFHLTTVDPPELVYFVRAQKEVEFLYPRMSMWELIVKTGTPPIRQIRYCCRELKEGGGSGRKCITGVRAAESPRRKKRRQVEVCLVDKLKTFIHIIFHWSDEDVWEYIKSRDLPYCSLYDEGYTRIGCICCPLASTKSRIRDAERFPTYKAAYIRAFQKMIDSKERIDVNKTGLARWKRGEDVWEWWVHRTYELTDEKQKVLIFED